MSERRYDLHTHSSVSDGTDLPETIAELAAKAGLAGFALTDHDTFAGHRAAAAAAAKFGIEFIPGVELTTKIGYFSPHILGYWLADEPGDLADKMTDLRRSRVERGQIMAQRLAQDFPISWESLRENTQAASIGRPHLADELIRAGVVQTRAEAFDCYLMPGGKYYEPSETLPATEAVRLITAAGGVAVLAHPAAFRNRYVLGQEDLEALCAAGLRGIELRHPENNPAHLPGFVEMAQELGLVVTGASDYHGAGKINRIGQESTAAEVVAQLREFAKS
ncbi:MAG: PHP domain-containing protein [Microbacteriaceae bacterium]|nr:PHP domain-containing protein [Microbacteriaceae bacterium]